MAKIPILHGEQKQNAAAVCAVAVAVVIEVIVRVGLGGGASDGVLRQDHHVAVLPLADLLGKAGQLDLLAVCEKIGVVNHVGGVRGADGQNRTVVCRKGISCQADDQKKGKDQSQYAFHPRASFQCRRKK